VDKEFATNKALLLWVIGYGTKNGHVLPAGRLAQVFYLSGKQLLKESIDFPDYNFFRYGPTVFSRQLYRDLHKLTETRLVNIVDATFVATDAGMDVFNHLQKNLAGKTPFSRIFASLQANIELGGDIGWLVTRDIRDFSVGEYLFWGIAGLSLPDEVHEAFMYAYDLTDEDVAKMNEVSDQTTEDVVGLLRKNGGEN
jgi:hypothetical protein